MEFLSSLLLLWSDESAEAELKFLSLTEFCSVWLCLFWAVLIEAAAEVVEVLALNLRPLTLGLLNFLKRSL